ncbi:MAG TPA: type II toxin-antitoxin system VapC family toxin [Vicinamibacterales bacterium]|nr:type II toxin-antitoxin system VapC family toxin [Vicinamibacterales bacterium]
MRVYADSSFLVSCYLIDANTPRAKAFLSEHDGPLPFTALHELEVRNALQLGVFRQVITNEQAKAAASAIDADLRDGRLVRTPVKWPAAFRATLKLSSQHAAKTGTRSLDILHIASAKALRMKELATFDSRQRALAAAAGLTEAV